MPTLPEILAAHAPYLSRRSDNKLCLRCLDDKAHGEFDTVEQWAQHVADALKAAGYSRAATSRGERTPGGLFA